MIYEKHTMDYELNLQALREMEDLVPMIRSERSALCRWNRSGHDVDANPWNYCDTDGIQMNYLRAFRIEFGYSSGPWDAWRESGYRPYWDDRLQCFVAQEDSF